MTAQRIAGMRGRIKGDSTGFPHIKSYLTTSHTPTYPVDETSGQTDWGMLANDQYGICTFAGREHYKMAKAFFYKLTEVWETVQALVAEYFAYDNGQDIGANIPDLLVSWYQAGKILAFGKLDHTNRLEVDWGVQTFHGVYCGVDLTDDADQLFNSHQPWTVGQGQTPNPNDGHCVIKIASTDINIPDPLDTYITWGALQTATKQWTAACLDEAYVIITEEDAKASGVDIAALRADIDAMLDEHGGVASPTPQPAPVPTPAPTPVAKLSWWQRLLHFLGL